ncbi:hypothetical protein CO251_12335 [Sulfobacillus sp. hq2]|nr:hypothetical protein CO251_12335 [Sulfobacillus sp. hq2]
MSSWQKRHHPKSFVFLLQHRYTRRKAKAHRGTLRRFGCLLLERGEEQTRYRRHPARPGDLPAQAHQWDEFFNLLTDRMLVGVDLHTDRFLYANAALQKMLGYSAQELQSLYVWDVLQEPYKSQIQASIALGLQDPNHVTATLIKAVRKDQQPIWLQAYATSVFYQGRMVRLANYIDITETMALKEQMDQEAATFYQVLDAIPTPVVIAREKFLYVNPATVTWCGYTPEEFTHMHLWDVLAVSDDLRHRMQINIQRRLAGESFTEEYPPIQIKGRTERPIWARIASRTLWHNHQWVILAVASDVTETVLQEHQLWQEKERYRTLSEVDSLTGIYNRRMFDRALQAILHEHALGRRRPVLIMFDLDNFKQLNDALGHHTGDRVLREVVRIIRSNLRSSDIFARYGGEEFTIIIPDTSLDAAYQLAERLRTATRQHDFHIGTAVTISLGLTALEREDTPETAIHRADAALYQAKRLGKDRVENG